MAPHLNLVQIARNAILEHVLVVFTDDAPVNGKIIILYLILNLLFVGGHQTIDLVVKDIFIERQTIVFFML